MALSKFQKYRRSKNIRIGVIILLMIILAILYFTWEKFRLFILGLFFTLLVALGLEISGNDWDLGKLIETGSFSESKMQQTESGMWLFGDDCKKELFNCSNFTYQEEAQDLFEKCGGGQGDDPHGLDRDNDGKVCEALRSRS